MNLLDALIKVIGDLLTALFGVLVDVLTFAYRQFFPEYKPYQSRFIAAGDVLHRRPTGFVVTGRRGLSIEESFRHLAVVGPTESRKTVTTILPTLLSADIQKAPKSFVVLDVSRQLFESSAGYLSSIGYRVITLNFRDVASSTRFNPILRADTPSNVRVLSSLLVRAALGDQTHDPFWSSAAQALLGSLIELLHEQPDPALRHLANVHELLVQMQASPDKFDEFVSRHASDRVYSRIKALYASGEKLMGSVIATCRTAVADYGDPEMAKLVAFDDLDFASFRDTPTAIFLQAPVMEAAAFATLTNVLLDQMLGEFMSEVPKPGQLPVFFCLDEVAVIRFRSLGTVLSNARKHKVAVCVTIQSEAMLEHVWSRAERTTIMANTVCKLYLAGQDLPTSTALEQVLGRREWETDRGKQIGPLLAREDVRTIGEYEGIVLIGHKSPVKARLVPFYRQRKLLRRSRMPVPVLETDHPEIKALDLKETYEEP